MEYFPEGSLTSIDMDQPEKAIQIIEACLRDELWEDSQEVRAQARELVLDKYNLFAVMADFVEARIDKKEPRVKVTIRPDVSWKHKVIRSLMRVKRMLRG